MMKDEMEFQKYFFIATFFYFQQTTITTRCDGLTIYVNVRREVLAGRGQSGESKKRPLSTIVVLLVYIRYIFSSNQIVLKISFSLCFWEPDLLFDRF